MSTAETKTEMSTHADIEVIKPCFEFINAPGYDTLLDTVEQAYRVCYKSESNSDTAESFIKSKLDMGHESPVEHCCITVKITTNRGVTHELVRHRLASYSQESTRYCNYGKDKFGNKVKFIKPNWTSDKVVGVWDTPRLLISEATLDEQVSEKIWLNACMSSADNYMKLLELGLQPQQARGVLSNDLATTIVTTLNIRGWRHFFDLRALGTTGKPHPDMLDISVPMLEAFAKAYPIFFGDQWEAYQKKCNEVNT